MWIALNLLVFSIHNVWKIFISSFLHCYLLDVVHNLKQLLDEFLQTYYNGSFSRMVSEYIRATGLTEAEVDALLEEMKHSSV